MAASARFSRLHYKSAASSSRAASDLSPLSPLPQRAVTTLGDPGLTPFPTPSPIALSPTPSSAPSSSPFLRAMSASCIPPSPAARTSHSCPKCIPPAPHRHPRFTPTLTPALDLPPPRPTDPDFRPTPLPPIDALRRTRSAYKPRVSAVLGLGIPRPRGPRPHLHKAPKPGPAGLPSQPPVFERPAPPPIRAGSPRAVYNATTASARAAALRQEREPRNGNAPVGFLVQPRDAVVREKGDLGNVPSCRSSDRSAKTEDGSIRSATDPKRGTRIVVRRRLIRGTSVFRQATEDELEELLQRERYREMVIVDKCRVDVPPVVPNAKPLSFEDLLESDRDVCAQCANPTAIARRQAPRRGVRRVSSLLTRHLGLDGEPDNVIDVAEMASMDECAAVAHFLRELRKCRKEMFFSLQDKAFERAPDRSYVCGKKKDLRRGGRERRHAKDMEKYQKKISQRRSLSADDPVLMRALLRQEHLLSHAATKKGKRVGGVQKPVDDDMKVGDHVGKVDVFENYDRERSQSELVLRFGDKQTDMDDAWKRVLNNFGRSQTSDGSVTKPVKTTRFAPLPPRPPAHGDVTSRKKTDSSGLESKLVRLPTEGDDEDEYGAHAMRILTAIEPVDPSIGLDEGNARRGTSYHMGSAMPGMAGSRRRLLSRGIRSDGERERETGLLRRLRSFRRRADERRS